MSGIVAAILEEVVAAVASGASVTEALETTAGAGMLEEIIKETGKAEGHVQQDVLEILSNKKQKLEDQQQSLDISVDENLHSPKRKQPHKRSEMPKLRKDDEERITRRPIPIDEGDDTMDPDVPLSTTTRSAAPQGASNNNMVKNQETELVDLGYAIYRPFKDTTQVLMPLHGAYTWSFTSAITSAGAAKLKIRLNSINDCFSINFLTANTNATPGADTQSGTLTNPQMRTYWSNIYRYFSVVGCKYKITFREDTRSINSSQMMVYEYLHGQQDPPIVDGGGTNLVTHDWRQHHPNCRFKALNASAGYTPVLAFDSANATVDQYGVSPSIENINHNTVQFTGLWKPGTIKHEVLEDQFQETWTLFSAAPKQHEYLTYILTHSPYGHLNEGHLGRVFIDMQYIVQLKDLDYKYQYLADNYSFPAIANFTNAVNKDSAAA